MAVRSGGELAIEADVAGDLDIAAQGGTVRFAQTLALSSGATLRIDGADAVRFAAGMALSGSPQADAVRITSGRAGGSVVSFDNGVLAGDGHSVEFAGLGLFAPQVRVDG